MPNRKKITSLLCILIATVTLTALNGCSQGAGAKRYRELIKSYGRDSNYKKNTDSIKKSVKTVNAGRPEQVFRSTLKPKAAQKIANNGKLKGIPILIYHCVDSDVWGDKPMFVSPDHFESQMQYLKEHGYTTITFKDLNMIDTIEKPVLITFDDGYEDNYTNAYPILKKYGFKATIFMITDYIDRPKFLQLQQIREMADTVDFESHTVTHPHLASLAPQEIEYQLSESKKCLEGLLHKKVDVLAYPYGSFDSRVIGIAKNHYSYAVTTNYGEFFDKPKNDYTIRRMYVVNQMNLDRFIRLFH